MGAAKNLAEVAVVARNREDIAVSVVAADPAWTFMDRQGIEAKKIQGARYLDPNSSSGKFLQAEARQVIECNDPDVIVVGSSGPDAGIDEAIMMSAGDIPVLVFQDFWGDVNPVVATRPDRYLVIDRRAADLTHRRTGVVAEVVGSPAHRSLTGPRLSTRREQIRNLWQIGPDRPCVVILGQSLHHVEGYWRQWTAFVDSVQRIAPDAAIFYRAHPRESGWERNVATIEAASGVQINVANELETVDCLAASDIAVSAFSMTGLDLAYANRLVPRGLSVPLFLLFESSIKEYFWQYTSMRGMPIAEEGMAIEITNVDELDLLVVDALRPSTRAQMHYAAVERLPSPDDAADSILSAAKCFSDDSRYA